MKTVKNKLEDSLRDSGDDYQLKTDEERITVNC